MKTLHYGILIAAALVATAASSHSGTARLNQTQMSIDSRAGDGAYRDGLFLGHHDRNQGFRHHVASGRWNSSPDRLSFAAGYEHGFSTTN